MATASLWVDEPPDTSRMVTSLREVIDPELGVNIVDLGLVYGLSVAGGLACVRITLTTPGCPLGAYLDDNIRGALAAVPNVADVVVQTVWEPSWSPTMMSQSAKSQLGWRG